MYTTQIPIGQTPSIQSEMRTVAFSTHGLTFLFSGRPGRASASTCSTLKMKASGETSTQTEEHFDIINESGVPQKWSKPRSQVHRDGDWHRSTHIWVFSREGQVLLQLRSAAKDTFPGKWDVSAAGHISAGDESLASAERELEEELGITLKPGESLDFLTSVKACATGETERYGPYVDNEIQDVYVYWPRETIRSEDMILQKEEVEKVEYWDWQEFRDRSLRGDEALVPRGQEYKDVIFPYFEREVQKKRMC